jgi:hypothetical protein
MTPGWLPDEERGSFRSHVHAAAARLTYHRKIGADDLELGERKKQHQYFSRS